MLPSPNPPSPPRPFGPLGRLRGCRPRRKGQQPQSGHGGCRKTLLEGEAECLVLKLVPQVVGHRSHGGGISHAKSPLGTQTFQRRT